jgi:hypothetical protein
MNKKKQLRSFWNQFIVVPDCTGSKVRREKKFLSIAIGSGEWEIIFITFVLID